MSIDLKNYDPALKYGANIGVSVDLTDIVDNNGNEVIELDGASSAVNYFRVSNAATTNAVGVSAQGDDTNVGLAIDGKGSGTIVLAGTSTGGITLTTAVTASSSVLSTSATAGVGYGTGAGGTVTQGTSRSTGVTLSKTTGQITTDTTSLAAGASATFTVTNTTVAATDVVVTSIQSAATTDQTNVRVTAVAAGSFDVTVENNHASTAETGAIVINFAVIKGVAA